jgi:hypothetical protein
MPNVCEECSAVNTDDATVCRTCGYPLFLASATPRAPFGQAGAAWQGPSTAEGMVPGASRRSIVWLGFGVLALAFLALAAFMFDGGVLPPQRTQFGPDAPRAVPVLPAPLVAPASVPSMTAEAAQAVVPAPAASAASAVAAPQLRPRSPALVRGIARKESSLQNPVSGTMVSPVPEPEPPVANLPAPGPDASGPAAVEKNEESPSELCGDKSLLALGVCLAEQCNTPALIDHPDCVQIREQDNRRREREALGG